MHNSLNPNVMKVSYLNTRSLVNKFENIKSDKSLQQSDILVLAETWIPKNTDTRDKFKLENYETHLNSSGRGKGLAIFQKHGSKQISDHNEENMNITMIELEDLDIVTVYRSTDGDLGRLVNKLEDIINISKSTLVIGDMNVCNKKMPTNELRKFLEDKDFKQVINKATHIEGGHLNHVYIKNMGNYVETPDIVIIPKYYSDHDAICISWKKVDSKED